jgi:SAM-dependent methyltransferase
MDLAAQYRRQFAWREWPMVLDALPPLAGATVLDLGCGVGDLAAQLVARGARVIGIDADDALIQEAQSLRLPNAQFIAADIAAPLPIAEAVDGIWCSFVPAYFPALGAALSRWCGHLKLGGWIALTEVDDLFGHEPLGSDSKALLNAYAADALSTGVYDFHMGAKLSAYLQATGLTLLRDLTLRDRELAFDGPAEPAVLDAWRDRFDRMKRLQAFCGERFDTVRRDFLNALSSQDHRSRTKVVSCIALNQAGTPAQRRTQFQSA